MTAPAVQLSAECGMAKENNVAELHSYCRSAKDIPLPGAHGLLLAKASCRCWCHGAQMADLDGER